MEDKMTNPNQWMKKGLACPEYCKIAEERLRQDILL